MKNFKNGFTVAEMLICIVVAGALAAMLIPSIIHNKPDKNKAMYRKAYYIAERVAAELIMDEDNFPGEGDVKGFAFYDKDSGAFPARTRANTGKYLCDQFAKKVSTNGTINCTTSKSGVGSAANGTVYPENKISFTTNDGITWIMSPNVICDPTNPLETSCEMPTTNKPSCSWTSSGVHPYVCVIVDVNGSEGPNKLFYHGDGNESHDVKNADRSGFWIYYNGKIQVPPGQSSRALKSTSVF